MRRLVTLLAVVFALGAAPAASASARAATVLPNGPSAGGPPPAPVFQTQPTRSFKIEVLHL